MKFQRKSYNSVRSLGSAFHVLTYAEEGFSPLNQHTKEADLSKEQLVAFADLVNARNETGSLHPLAYVSAVPRALIRDQKNPEALSMCIEDFYLVNASELGSKRVLLDFRSPSVDRFVLRAIEMSLRSPNAKFIEELIVVDDAAS